MQILFGTSSFVLQSPNFPSQVRDIINGLCPDAFHKNHDLLKRIIVGVQLEVMVRLLADGDTFRLALAANSACLVDCIPDQRKLGLSFSYNSRYDLTCVDSD